jgi:curli biogenesis system outer membrane secretion channel CsgG
MHFIKVILLFSFLIFSFPGCATVHKDTIEPINTGPTVSPTIQQAQTVTKPGLKRKVAIARFTNETRYGQSFFLNQSDDRIGKQAVDILSSKLMETEKFILLERADLDKIQKELTMGNASPLKNMSDYLIVGSVTEFGRKDQSEVGIFSRTKKQTAYAKVHIRLIDVYSGQIIYSEEGDGESFSEAGTVFGVGQKAGYDSSLNDKALEAAITNLSSNIIENLLGKEWRAYILGYEDGLFIISGGKSQNISPGDKFDVMEEGKKINNPQTNMMITLPGKKIGEISVLQSIGDTIENEVSLCEINSGLFQHFINTNDYSKLFIREPK